jgi:cyclic dehypoxanthinyl futalosine synthase
VNTKLERLDRTVTGVEYLKVMALSRIVLDNIPHIQSSWITQGLKIGQTGLCLGANDIGGLLLEENVVTAAGINPTTQTVEEVVKTIHKLGRDAVQRITAYEWVKQHPQVQATPALV